jgi:hypothetical protein
MNALNISRNEQRVKEAIDAYLRSGEPRGSIYSLIKPSDVARFAVDLGSAMQTISIVIVGDARDLQLVQHSNVKTRVAYAWAELLNIGARARFVAVGGIVRDENGADRVAIFQRTERQT